MDTRRPALSLGAAAAAVVPLAFLAFFFVFPLVTILERGLTSGARRRSCPAGTAALVWFTVWQAAASTVLTLVGGTAARVGARTVPLPRPLARAGARARPVRAADGGRRDGVPRAAARRVGSTESPAILAAHVYFNVAVVTRIVGGTWATIDRRSSEAAAVLGAGPWRRAREVTLPQLAPALSAAGALTFLFCFTSFGVILILGGPARATVETEIYNRAARLFDLQAAAALSLLQLGAVAIVLAVASVLEARAGRGRDDRGREGRAPAPGRLPSAFALAAVLGLGAILLGLPLAVLVRRSLGNWGALFEETPALLVEPWRAAEYSLAFASRGRSDRARRRGPRRDRARPAAGRGRRRARPAPARRLGRDARLRVHHHVRRVADRLPLVVVARPRGAVARGARRSSSASSRRRCAPSIRGCAMQPPRSARRPGAPGGRSTCRSSRARSASRRGSRSRSRSASSGRPSSSRAPSSRRCRWRSSASSGARARRARARRPCSPSSSPV